MKYVLALLAMFIVTPALASIDMSHAEFFERSKTGDWKEPASSNSFATQEPTYVNRRVIVRGKNGKKRVRYVRTAVVPKVETVRTHSTLKKQAVADMVAKETARRLGSQWVPTALKLAKIESSFNCGAVGPNTRHGRARGVLQVMPGSARAMGYEPSRLNECAYGIAAGVSHMALCIQSGVRTHDQMASCHVSGVQGWKVRLNSRAEAYKRKYVRLAAR
jgi:hypothetical protein